MGLPGGTSQDPEWIAATPQPSQVVQSQAEHDSQVIIESVTQGPLVTDIAVAFLDKQIKGEVTEGVEVTMALQHLLILVHFVDNLKSQSKQLKLQ